MLLQKNIPQDLFFIPHIYAFPPQSLAFPPFILCVNIRLWVGLYVRKILPYRFQQLDLCRSPGFYL